MPREGPGTGPDPFGKRNAVLEGATATTETPFVKVSRTLRAPVSVVTTPPKALPIQTYTDLDTCSGVDVVSYTFALQAKLPRAPLKAVSISSVNELHVPTYGVFWVEFDLCDFRGTIRRVRKPCVAIDRDFRQDGAPLLLSYGTMQDLRLVIDAAENRWWFSIDSTKVQLAHPRSFYRSCRDLAYCYAIVTPPEEVWKEEEAAPPGAGSPIPGCLRDFTAFFDTEKCDILPAHRRTDHAIDLVPGGEPPHMPIYPLSYVELQALREWLDKMKAGGKIRESQSPAGAPILFVPKKDGTLRLCVDYRRLNKVTIKNRYTLPLISELLDRVSQAKVFSKVDLKDAYYRIRIKPGDEWKTAFRTRYGHFEFLVMAMGLTNAPATFQHYITQALGNLVDTCCVVYIDDVLIYSPDEETHEKHLKLVVERLLEADLYAKTSKCQFFQDSLEFLGYRISAEGIAMDPARVDTVREWPEPESIHDMQVFLGFCNFYRRFIDGYSRTAAPLTRLLQGSGSGEKAGHLALDAPAREAFRRLKQAFERAPLLIHFDPEKQIRLETDASRCAMAGTLSQEGPGGQWHPVSFWSKKFSGAELNYGTPDQEMLAIVSCFKHWRHYLEGAKYPTEVLSDHQNLQSFMKTDRLNGRQARWCMYLAPFDFAIRHQPGKRNPADGPSRRPDYTTAVGDNLALLPTLERKLAVAASPPDRRPRILANAAYGTRQARERTVFSQAVTRRRARQATQQEEPYANNVHRDLEALIREAQRTDEVCQEQRSRAADRSVPTGHWGQSATGLVCWQGRAYVPAQAALRAQILEAYHDDPHSGHFGTNRTLELVERKFYWPGLGRDARAYVKDCSVCLGAKAKHHRPYGELSSLPQPQRPGEEYSMDFITGLPESFVGHQAVDSILVIVDRFTKMAFFIPVAKTINAPELARLFHERIECWFGAAKGIVSDRGSVFTSCFWSELCYYSKVKLRYSTAFHPQTDGQTERINQVIETYLRCYAAEQPELWPNLVQLAFYAINSAVNATIGISPFEALYGYQPDFHAFVEDDFPREGAPAVRDRLSKLDTLRQEMRERWRRATEAQARHYNAHHKPMTLRVGQKVGLSTRNLKVQNRKLAPKFIGPFRVLERIGPLAYRLALPEKYARLHNVFPIQLLEPWEASSPDALPMPELEDDEEWEVEEVRDKMVWEDQTYYLVKWKGWPAEYNQWEPAEHLQGAPTKVAQYEKRHPDTGTKRKGEKPRKVVP